MSTCQYKNTKIMNISKENMSIYSRRKDLYVAIYRMWHCKIINNKKDNILIKKYLKNLKTDRFKYTREINRNRLIFIFEIKKKNKH